MISKKTILYYILFILLAFNLNSLMAEDFRLSVTKYGETENLDEISKNLFGSDASIADWDDIAAMIGNDTSKLTEFYEQIGLEDEGCAMVSKGGELFYNGGNRQYYLQRFDDGPYSGFAVHAQIGTLYLGSWYGLSMNILAKTVNDANTHRLSVAKYSETENLDEILKNLFGSDASIADWDHIDTMIGNDTSKLNEFYEQIGLEDEGCAMVSKGGELFYNGGNRQYYLQRFDDGPYSGFAVHAQIGTLYLGSWYGLSMNILAKTVNNTNITDTHRLSVAKYSETENLDEIAKNLFGSDASIADWDDIEAMIGSDTSKLSEYYEQIGLEDEGCAMVSKGGELFYNGGNRQYYLQRFDDGPYSGFAVHAQIGTLYLGSWYGLSMNILAKTVNDANTHRLSVAKYSETENLDEIAKNLFGSDASIADWDDIATMIGSDTSKLSEYYEQIGLEDEGCAMVSKGGELFYNGGNRQYYLQRFDDGPYSGFAVHAQIGTLYLGSWYGLSMNILAKTANSVGIKDDFTTKKEKSLLSNYPNPFNPTTTINYIIPDNYNGLVNLSIYNANGQIVEKLINKVQTSGNYNISFNAGKLTSGLYYYVLKTEELNVTRKMILAK